MDKELKLFSGNANPALAREICGHLGVGLGEATVSSFSDGEIRVRIEENVRGADVFVLQSCCTPVNNSIMELLIMIDALKRSSAYRITAVIPYFGYARQDRKEQPRVPISAKLMADLITTAGGVERARAFAKRLQAQLAIIDKRREGPNNTQVMNIIGDVDGRNVLLLDDMIDTAGTIVQGAQACAEKGARMVWAGCTHPVLSGPELERLQESCLTEVVVTNTIPLTAREQRCPKLRVLSVAPLLGEAITRIHSEESVSSLFA